MRRALKTYPVIAIDVKILPCTFFFFLSPSLFSLSFSPNVTFYCKTFVQFMFIIITHVYIFSVTYVSSISKQNVHLSAIKYNNNVFIVIPIQIKTFNIK